MDKDTGFLARVSGTVAMLHTGNVGRAVGMTVEAMMQPIPFTHFAISAPRERAAWTWRRGR